MAAKGFLGLTLTSESTTLTLLIIYASLDASLDDPCRLPLQNEMHSGLFHQWATSVLLLKMKKQKEIEKGRLILDYSFLCFQPIYPIYTQNIREAIRSVQIGRSK